MTKGENVKVSLALYKMAMVENAINDIDFIKDEKSLETINDVHIAMNILAQMIVDDTDRSIKLRNETRGLG